LVQGHLEGFQGQRRAGHRHPQAGNGRRKECQDAPEETEGRGPDVPRRGGQQDDHVETLFNNYWPSVYLIDKEGIARWGWQGELGWKAAQGEVQVRAKIEELLKEETTIKCAPASSSKAGTDD
jgi:hypothetical protein